MNDCFWYNVMVCEADNCMNCPKYVSMNTEEGYKKSEEYEAEVEKALIPVRDKYKEKFNALK